jgi:SWIM zinc finger
MKQIQIERKQSRFSKGVVIAASRRILKVHGEEAWLVESETTDDKFYKVTEDGTCDCKDFEIRGGPCKHVWALIRRGIA